MKNKGTRPHKPDRSKIVDDLQSECEAVVSVTNSLSGPIQWRDRIREIDSASKEEEARHCAAMAAYDEERTSLAAKLKDEGFALIQSDEPNSEVESAQQDMSDWRNWEIGDLVTVIDNEGEADLEVGKHYKVVFLADHDYKGICPAQLKHNDCCWLDLENMKWHSRPTN